MDVRSKYRSWRAEDVSEPLVVTGCSKTPDTGAGHQWFSARAVPAHNRKQGFGLSSKGTLCLSLALSGSVSVRNTCLSRKHISHFFSSRSRHMYYFPEGKRKLSELGNI